MRLALSMPGVSGLRGWLPTGLLQLAAEDRHSRRVALLKRLFPATGVALLLLIMMWPRLSPMWDRMRLSFPAIDLREAGDLRMVNPRYAGTDRLGRPFVVTAAVGHQVPDRQDLMSLDKPRADMKTHSGAYVVLNAATGVYQSQSQLLDLFGNVTLVHENGTRFVTDTAHADAAHNTAEGDDPVEGHGPSGDVKAQGFRILDRGDKIIFTGKSDMLLRGARPAGNAQAPAPAGLPPDVMASAAHAEQEARPLLTAAKPTAAAPKPRPATRISGKHTGKAAAKKI